jgi:hypothetical protein
MPKYVAKVNIDDGEKQYAPGDELTLTGDAADQMLAAGAVESVAEAKAAEKADEPARKAK